MVRLVPEFLRLLCKMRHLARDVGQLPLDSGLKRSIMLTLLPLHIQLKRQLLSRAGPARIDLLLESQLGPSQLLLEQPLPGQEMAIQLSQPRILQPQLVQLLGLPGQRLAMLLGFAGQCGFELVDLLLQGWQGCGFGPGLPGQRGQGLLVGDLGQVLSQAGGL